MPDKGSACWSWRAAARPVCQPRLARLVPDRVLLEMSLQELRQRVGELSQADLAEALQATQGYISKLERQDDMLVSKLPGNFLRRSFVIPAHAGIQGKTWPQMDSRFRGNDGFRPEKLRLSDEPGQGSPSLYGDFHVL